MKFEIIVNREEINKDILLTTLLQNASNLNQRAFHAIATLAGIEVMR